MKVLIIGGAVFFGLAAIGTALGDDDNNTSSSDDVGIEVESGSGDGSDSVVVTYEVDGSAFTADVTVETPTGTEQDEWSLPDEAEYDFAPGDFVYISAQNTEEGGDVTCRILVDGAVIAENTSRGDFAIAQCDGSA